MARSAGWAFSVRSRSSAGPSHASALIASPSASSAAAKTAAAAGDVSARARPIPTDWDPWPGKTKANRVIGRKGRAGDRSTPRFACTVAWTCRGAVRFAPCPNTAPDPPRGPSRAAPSPASSRPTCRAPVLAAGNRLPNVRQISERVAMGRALWRELVIGFAGQLGELRLGFTQLAALYVLADGSTMTVGELAEEIGRSPSATSRLVDGLVRRRFVERHQEPEDRRQRTLRLTPRGHAILRVVDRARADQFLNAVRPLPTAERAIVAMGVAALATHAINRRGRLIRAPRD